MKRGSRRRGVPDHYTIHRRRTLASPSKKLPVTATTAPDTSHHPKQVPVVVTPSDSTVVGETVTRIFEPPRLFPPSGGSSPVRSPSDSPILRPKPITTPERTSPTIAASTALSDTQSQTQTLSARVTPMMSEFSLTDTAAANPASSHPHVPACPFDNDSLPSDIPLPQIGETWTQLHRNRLALAWTASMLRHDSRVQTAQMRALDTELALKNALLALHEADRQWHKAYQLIKDRYERLATAVTCLVCRRALRDVVCASGHAAYCRACVLRSAADSPIFSSSSTTTTTTTTAIAASATTENVITMPSRSVLRCPQCPLDIQFEPRFDILRWKSDF